jgi:hypothetical protein
MNDLPDTIDQIETRLNARIETLERRICALEHPDSAARAEAAPATAAFPSAPAPQALPITSGGSIFPVLGKAMLGIAGAYMLRAVAEANIAPQALIAVLAIVYAILWLVWAARVPADAWFAGAAYACTSALILAPMLWELTLRFNILSADATAIALAAFVVSAFALTILSAREANRASNRNVVLWVASVTAAVLSVALSIATHQFPPFVAVLLFMVLVSEAGAALDHGGINRWGSIRILAAVAADFALLIFIYIYSGPASARANYPGLESPWLIAPAIVLLLICATGILIHCGLRRKSIATFAAVQTTIAFLLAAGSLLAFAPPPAAIVLGLVCLALSVACYAAVFTLFNDRGRGPDQHGNHLVFSTWSAALALAGFVLCLQTGFLTACLGAAGVAATLAGTRLNRPLLAWHGAAYLFASAAAAGLFAYVFHVLAGAMPAALTANVCIAALCSILCYAVSTSFETEPWKQQMVHLATAGMAAVSATALLVQALVGLISLRMEPGAHHLAFIRTLILCATALALAFAGDRWRRRELARIGYATLALVAVKLAVEDLPLGNLAYIAASIFLFAIALIAVPRVAHRRQHS